MALSDYTILTYIESQGAQYIVTGLTNSRNITFDLECSWDLEATPYAQCIIGATADSRNAGVKVSGTGTNNLTFWWGRNGGGNATVQTNTFYKMHTTTDGSSTLLYIDDNYIASTDGEVKSRDIWLFGDSYSGYSNHQCPWAKLKYCKIYDSGTLVRDYIPAKRKSDNVLGLYDKINDVFYVNSGSGTFIEGEEAPYYTVSAQLSPSEAEGNISISSTRVQAGFPVTVQYTDTLNKWRLVSWSVAGSPVSPTNPYTFILEGDTTIIANVENYGRCILM